MISCSWTKTATIEVSQDSWSLRITYNSHCHQAKTYMYCKRPSGCVYWCTMTVSLSRFFSHLPSGRVTAIAFANRITIDNDFVCKLRRRKPEYWPLFFNFQAFLWIFCLEQGPNLQSATIYKINPHATTIYMHISHIQVRRREIFDIEVKHSGSRPIFQKQSHSQTGHTREG